MSVAYFTRPGLPGRLRGIRLEYFFSALEILRDEPPSPTSPIVVLGMSRGSEPAMLTAIHWPFPVRAVVATVPGNKARPGQHPTGPRCMSPDSTARHRCQPSEKTRPVTSGPSASIRRAPRDR